MLLSCWSAKGGVGTTVVAAALALLARRHPGGAVLADLGGDGPAVLGVPDDPYRPGLTDWVAAAPGVPPDAIGRLEQPAAPGLALLCRGGGPLDHAAIGGGLLAGVLAADPRTVVADCGRLGPAGAADVPTAVAAGADRSLAVVRPCFLAVRRTADAPVRPTGVVLVDEPGRALHVADVAAAIGAPVVARVRVTDRVARAVDAGLLATGLPRSLAEDLRGAL